MPAWPLENERGQEKSNLTEISHARGPPDKESNSNWQGFGSVSAPSARGDARKLVEAAMANGRSLNDEIIHRLKPSLERDEMQKLSDRLKAQGDRLAKFEGEIAAMVEQLRLRDD